MSIISGVVWDCWLCGLLLDFWGLMLISCCFVDIVCVCGIVVGCVLVWVLCLIVLQYVTYVCLVVICFELVVIVLVF